MKFQDPPPSYAGRGRPVNPVHLENAAALKARPGEWALVYESVASNVGSSIKRAQIKAYAPAGSFEATSRGVGNEKFDVYVRYVGEPPAA